MDRFSAVPIAVFTVAVGQISTAADIPTKAPLTTITPFPIYNWTDLYVSGKVGNLAGLELPRSRANLTTTSVSDAIADRLRESKISDLLLLTGRLGYASYNWPGYINGGYANSQAGFNTFAASIGLRNTTSSGGWTVRGGIDYAFNPFASTGVEYNLARINIAERDQSVSPSFVTPETLTGENADIQTVWAPLNNQARSTYRSH